MTLSEMLVLTSPRVCHMSSGSSLFRLQETGSACFNALTDPDEENQ